MTRIKKLLAYMLESTVDYPHENLSDHVWDSSSGVPVLRDSVKSLIDGSVRSLLGTELYEKVDDIYVIGSICSNLYTDDSDIDIDIIVKDKTVLGDTTELIDKITNFNANSGLYVGPHQLTLYLPDDIENAIAISEGVYSVKSGLWIKGPMTYPMDYDPYWTYKHVMGMVKDLASSADVLLGDLYRDTIDYDVMVKAIKQLPDDIQSELITKIMMKINEIESNVANLVHFKTTVKDLRGSYKNEKLNQALMDAETTKTWNSSNAVYKMLNRYNYMKLISKLAELVDDGSVSHKDVAVINKILRPGYE